MATNTTHPGVRTASRFTTSSRLHHSIFTPRDVSRGSLRRMSERVDQPQTIVVDDLEITRTEGLVRAGGQVLTLSVREFQLLVAMVEHAGGIVGRAELCRAVWGRELRAGDRSVDVYVSKLRAKLEQAVPERRYIHTHPSFGYRFQSQLTRDVDAAKTAAARPAEPGAAEQDAVREIVQ
jgi:DNA-binding winged helix-turn-helix (wHTH) protein